MLKSTVSVLVAAVLLSPAAFAESGKQVTLKHDYDAALLSSDEGASFLVTELTRAAKRACTSRVPVYGGLYTDQICTASLVSSAVKEIHEAQSAAGVEIAPSFERIALTQLASAD